MEDDNVKIKKENLDELKLVGGPEDEEFLECESDVESVDSFENEVEFFPPIDDHDEEDRLVLEVNSANKVEEERYSFEPNWVDAFNSDLEFSEASKFIEHPRAVKPGPAHILQALTMSSSNDFVNLERMETIGDSFLKFVVTVHQYLVYQNAHEGMLSYLRSQIVCNSHLYALGKAKHLPEMMTCTKFEPNESWVPPGYFVPFDSRLPQCVRQKIIDEEVKKARETFVDAEGTLKIDEFDSKATQVLNTISNREVDVFCNRIQHYISDKSVADCVEALIGCYLTSRGERSALRFIKWIGIDCMPPTTSESFSQSGYPWVLPKTAGQSSAKSMDVVAHKYAIDEVAKMTHLHELEEKLHYKFSDMTYLVQAFTHPSYHQLIRCQYKFENGEVVATRIKSMNQSNMSDIGWYDLPLTDTECYQRLEFLGDAVLDYVITRFLYEDAKCHPPGVLTDLRSALVNNNIFAALAVRADLHKYLRASSPQLFHSIDAFVKYQKDIVNDDLDFITNEDIEFKEPTDVVGDNLDKEDALLNMNEDRNANEVDPDNITEDIEGGTSVMFSQDYVKKADTMMNKNLADPFVSDAGDTDHNTLANLKEGNKCQDKPVEDVEIPKALGDIFESLAGAVFLDSNLNLNEVWRVFYPLMKERIERYTACIPKSPVRELLELEPDVAKFRQPRRMADGRIRVCAHIIGKGRFYGVGRNYRIAKSLAAKRALKVLHRRNNENNN